MRNTFRLAFVVVLVAGLAACSQVAPNGPSLQTLAANGGTRSVSLAGTSTFRSSTTSVSGFQSPELSPVDIGGAADTFATKKQTTTVSPGGPVVNRVPKKSKGKPLTPPAGGGTSSSASAALTFQGLDHFNQRYADNGNQFSVEPPDQGLCVGSGYVLEAVNDVAQVYDASGNPAMGVVSLNKFFGYASAIDRSTVSGQPKFGPFVTDPSCVFDDGHFYLTVLTLDTSSGTGAATGHNQLDVAVSQTSDPTGSWYIYHLDVTNDGQNCPCLGDYPHIATNGSGFFITTDSFPLSSNNSPDNNVGYNSAWVYAFDKAGLAAGASKVNLASMPMVDSQGLVGYSVAPANSVGGYPDTANGTEYFLSATTVFTLTGDQIVVWALDGTDSLATGNPHVTLSSTRVSVTGSNGITGYGDPIYYAVPQKAGDVPLAQALNANLFGYGQPKDTQVEMPVATNDSGMKQTVFVNGHLYGALTTVADNGAGFNHGPGAGVAWFDVTPSMGRHGVSASLAQAGIVAPHGTNLIFPAITVNASGQGVIAATQVGPKDYPSAAIVPFSAGVGAGKPNVVQAGAGPEDGFAGYFIGGYDPRWGDYGASTVDAQGNLWTASESIHQTCDYQTYLATSGTCGSTRSALANWSTQITKIAP